MSNVIGRLSLVGFVALGMVLGGAGAARALPCYNGSGGGGAQDYSPLDCSLLEVSPPYSLSFDVDHGGLGSGAGGTGTGTGFTMVDPPSARGFSTGGSGDPHDLTGTPGVDAFTVFSNDVLGYEPGRLTVTTSGSGTLRISATKGIQFRDPSVSTNTNSLINALGVGVAAAGRTIRIETSVINAFSGSIPTSSSQQGGLWFGLNEDNYAKLVVFSTGSGGTGGQCKIQLAVERYVDTPASTAPVESNTASTTLPCSTSTVHLSLLLNPTTNMASGTYQFGAGAVTALPATVPVPAAFFTGVDHDVDGGTANLSFMGLFATKRNALESSVIDLDFDRFEIFDDTPKSLVWTPSSVTFTAEPGAVKMQTVSLASSLSTANFTVDTSGAPAWVQSVVPSVGMTGTGGTAITLTVNTTGLPPGAYTATLPASAPGYTGASLTVDLTVVEPFPVGGVHKNFQDPPPGSPVPPGFTEDIGEPYGLRTSGETFGWITQASVGLASPVPVNFAGPTPPKNTRDRNRPGIAQELDTMIHMQYGDLVPPGSSGNPTPGAWEYALPNGTYRVTASVGDQPGGATMTCPAPCYDSLHTINVEGVTAINNFQATAPDEYEQGTVLATVTDNRLTVDAIGGTNTKLNYVHIEQPQCLVPADCSGALPACGEFACVVGLCVVQPSTGNICRSGNGTCDPAEVCDGASTDCPPDALAAPGTPCGDASDTVCTDPDTCDGNGTCLPNHAPTSTVCRAAVGSCDVAETCTASGTCPANAFVGSGVACGSGADTDCDNPDTCNGSGTCLANNEANGTTCTTDSNPCTVDQCSAGVCAHPAGNGGTVCRTAAGECDLAESCTGASPTCPSDIKKGSGVGCTDDGNQCTNDQCDGTNVLCQHPNKGAGAACGSAADTDCDNPDTCNGSGTCQINNEANGTTCTSDSNPCTVDQCSAGACAHPSGNAGTVCRAAADACDLAESCTGTSASCPADAKSPSGTACGSGADTDCDNPDTCNGAGTCQANNEANGTTCTSDSNPCTLDQCGAGACTHPAGNAGTVCRPAAGDCDVQETCDGASAACPADAKSSSGSGCPDDGNQCTNDQCDGTSVLCQHPDKAAGAACGSAADSDCDNPDTCNGAGACQTNHAADGSTCDDGNPCTTPDQCSAGACAPGPGPDCNDNNVCTTDTCDLMTGCAHTNNTDSCEDGDLCTAPDMCSAGLCGSGPNLGGQSCDSGLLGACMAGTTQCTAGDVTCVADTTAQPEVCGNAVDEDCDGEIDDADVCGGDLCLPADTISTTQQTKLTKIKLKDAAGKDKVLTKGQFTLPAAGALTPNDGVELRLSDGSGTYYAVTLPPGSFTVSPSGRSFRFKDSAPYANAGLKIAKLLIKGDGVTVKYLFKAQGLDQPAYNGTSGDVVVKVGNQCFEDSADACTAIGSGARCQ